MLFKSHCASKTVSLLKDNAGTNTTFTAKM
jgi:hypothetical protein